MPRRRTTWQAWNTHFLLCALATDAYVFTNEKGLGLYVAHVEADTWMAQPEAGVDIEPPVCHVKQKKADWSRNG